MSGLRRTHHPDVEITDEYRPGVITTDSSRRQESARRDTSAL